VPDLLSKQLIAIVDGRTTLICLDANGQVQPVDEPFVTLAGNFQTPPFHWHCRSHSGVFMAGFDDLPTLAAAAELARRQAAKDDSGPPAPPNPAPVADTATVERTAAAQASRSATAAARRRHARRRRRRSG
jgi:hypothetical protein